MVNKQDFEKYKAELQITIGNKITSAINKLNEAIIGKLESQVRLLDDAMINNEVKMNSTAQQSRPNNVIILGTPQSVKIKDNL